MSNLLEISRDQRAQGDNGNVFGAKSFGTTALASAPKSESRRMMIASFRSFVASVYRRIRGQKDDPEAVDAEYHREMEILSVYRMLQPNERRLILQRSLQLIDRRVRGGRKPTLTLWSPGHSIEECQRSVNAAYHEAEHAVMLYHYNTPIGYCTIIQDRRSHGVVASAAVEGDQALRIDALVALAGNAGQARLAGAAIDWMSDIEPVQRYLLEIPENDRARLLTDLGTKAVRVFQEPRYHQALVNLSFELLRWGLVSGYTADRIIREALGDQARDVDRPNLGRESSN